MSCGSGRKQRVRACDSPLPTDGGKDCDENEAIEIAFCQEEKVGKYYDDPFQNWPFQADTYG